MPCSIRLSTEEIAIFYLNCTFGQGALTLSRSFTSQCYRLAQHAAKPATVLVFMVINTPKAQGIFAWPTTKNRIRPV